MNAGELTEDVASSGSQELQCVPEAAVKCQGRRCSEVLEAALRCQKLCGKFFNCDFLQNSISLRSQSERSFFPRLGPGHTGIPMVGTEK